MNKIYLTGRLVKDPTLQQTQSGVEYCKFGLAVKTGIGLKDTEFFNCTAWRGVANVINDYCYKGSLICVIGEMVSSTYEKDGRNLTSWDVNVNDVELLGYKNNNDNNNNKGATNTEPAIEQIDLPF